MAILATGAGAALGTTLWKMKRVWIRTWYWLMSKRVDPIKGQVWWTLNWALQDHTTEILEVKDDAIKIKFKGGGDEDTVTLTHAEWDRRVEREMLFCRLTQLDMEDRYWGKASEKDC